MNSNLSRVVITEGKYKGKVCTELSAKYIHDDMGEPNGCGSGWMSRFFLSRLQSFTGAMISDDCNLHDTVYSIPMEEKSDTHKREEDANFELNIRNTLLSDGGWMVPNWLWSFEWYRRLDYEIVHALPDIYHMAVKFKGNKSYWSI